MRFLRQAWSRTAGATHDVVSRALLTFGRKRPRRFALFVAGAFVAAGIMATTGQALVSDGGTVNVQVTDRTGAVVDATTAQGSFVSYFGDSNTSFGSSGTGIFDPFVRLQGTPTEQGYNTSGATEFDTKVGTWTHAILVSRIPQRPCPQSPPAPASTETCFELFNDINENNSTPYISLNTVQVFYTDNPNLTNYSVFSSNSPPAGTTKEYDFNGDILIHDVNQGSGRGDLRFDIPIGSGHVPLPPNCNFGNPNCATYFVLYSKWGTSTIASPDGKGYSSDGGFEEWKVKQYPAITLTKTPSPANVCNGSNASVTYTYVVTNTGTLTVSGPVVDDNGTPGDTSDDVTVGTFSSLAPGASATFTHAFTVNGTRTNTATATATSGTLSTTVTATATVTGHTCTISLTKTPSTLNVCNASNTSVTYTYVVTNNSDFYNVSGSVSDNVLGSIGSFGPLTPGTSATLTKVATVNGTQSNTGTASGTFTDSKPTTATATADATVTGHTCTISLTKTPDKTTVCNGANTQVTYTYVVTNNSDFYNVSGSVSDNVYGSIGSFGPLTPGTSATLTKVATVNGTITNIGTATGTFNDPKPTSASAAASATVTGQNCNVSQITPTGTTCSQFAGNTSSTLSTLNYAVDASGNVSTVTPGVFFYWVKVTAAAGSNSFTINQTITTGNYDSHFFSQAAGSFVWDPNCNKVAVQSVTTSGGVTTVTFTAASAGTYFIGIKYDAKSVEGFTAPTPTTVHYDFSTAGVPSSTSGIDLVKS
jgi:hypothetical protein